MSDAKKTIRDIGTQLAQWAKSSGTTAAEWWEEKSAIARRTGQIRKLGKQQREVISEMGTKLYALHRRGKVRNRDLLADCARIDEINAEVEKLKAEIEEVRRRRREAALIETPLEDDSPIVDEADAEEPVAVEGAQAGAEPAPEAPPEQAGAAGHEEPGEGDASEEPGTQQ